MQKAEKEIKVERLQEGCVCLCVCMCLFVGVVFLNAKKEICKDTKRTAKGTLGVAGAGGDETQPSAFYL